MDRVVILGGGVGGLSAAHELVERGFEVAVFEQKPVWGGKARSYSKPGSGTGGRKDLPAEHGFRLFPGFYKHLPDTMKRIPFGDNPNGVFDNLVPTARMEVAREGLPAQVDPAHFPRTVEEWAESFQAMLQSNLGIPSDELRFFVGRLLVILTSCHERRLSQYEACSWWKFIEADGKSEAYQRLLGDGLVRRIFAVAGKKASARTMGNTAIQIYLDQISPGRTPVRVLNGPQSEVWIDPWVSYLTRRGVELHTNASLVRLNHDGNKITSATVRLGGREVEVAGDYYICAVPAEVMQRVAGNLEGAAPSLANLDRLQTDWKLGIQFYLRREMPGQQGYVLYADSKWALLSLSTSQFWLPGKVSEYGNGEVRGILSVDISDWHTPGDKVVRKPADQCTADEIRAEVWAQIEAHLQFGRERPVEEADVVDWHLDPDLRFPLSLPQNERNAEPMLINTAGSWQYRPEADLSEGGRRELSNLFLAADYVRTGTDVATMEAANEAARRAVNGILKAAGSGAPPCELWPPEEPALFAPLRAYDLTRFRLGYGHQLPSIEPVKKYLPRLGEWTPGGMRAAAERQSRYQFHEHWEFRAHPEQVWQLVAEPSTYPDWWDQYPVVKRLNSVKGVGAAWEMHIQFQPRVPYRLRFVLQMLRCDAPYVAEWRAEGDLKGRVSFTLNETEMGTGVIYDSDLTIDKLTLNAVSPLTRRFFTWNHEAMMKRAQADLRTELTRRAVRAGN